MIAGAAQLEVKPPTILTPRAIVTISLYGLILVVPVLVSMMVVSVLQFGALTFVVPLGTIALATFFLPLGFGNPYVTKLVRPLHPRSNGDLDFYVVQLTRNPRNRSGLLALLEDADDIGYLSFTDSVLVFNGDSIRLTVPFDHIEELKRQTTGWRALFAYGPQTTFSVAGLGEAGTFAFVERSSWVLPTSRRNASQMYQRLSRLVARKAEQHSEKAGEQPTNKL